ncbi:MAG: hypothetical protein WA958_04565 [Tunicatimonas sp.]
MRVPDAVILSLCATLFVIGVHQAITVGFVHSYWLIMLSSLLLLWYKSRRRRESLPSPPAKKSKTFRRKKASR